jgi:hypothetical protein
MPGINFYSKLLPLDHLSFTDRNTTSLFPFHFQPSHMTNPYTRVKFWSHRMRQLGLTALLAGGATVAAQAQTLNYSTATTTTVAGTFTDLAATGTVITTANTDDANSAAQNIGFSFRYNGVSFTQFVLNTNGLIRLGSAAPSAANMFLQNEASPAPVGIDPIASTSTADVNLLAPFNFDLEAGSSAAEYRVSTTGTSPNRVCTIQWKNVHDKAAVNASQYANFTFQVKLYETTNVIEYVYNSATAATIGAEIGRYASIGIKGSGIANGQNVLITKGSSATLWPNATLTSGTGTRFFFRRTVGPDVGRTFRFAPVVIPANEAAVLALYTLPKLAIPTSTPHVVRTAIANYGSAALNNLVVTLRVTGSNPFTTTTTVPRVAVGDTVVVSFPGFSPTVLGTNTVSVSVPSDGNNTNNSQTTSQSITSNTAGYTRLNEGNSSGLGNGTGGGMFVARFSANAPTTVNTVSVFISSFTGFSPVGRTLYAVVTNPTTGAIIGRSADYVVAAADVNAVKAFTINAIGTTTPLTVPAGDFMAGLAIPAFTGTTYYPLGLQAESPTRPNSFYYEDLGGSIPEDVASAGFGVFMIDTNLGTAPSCLPPTAATFTAITGTTAQVSFTGGSASPTGYTIIYGPAGFDPTSTAAGTTITSATLPISLSGLTPNTVYQVYVRTNCSATSQSSLSGPFQLQTGCAPNTVITAFPYSENFDSIIPGQPLPCGVAVLDANTDGATWAINKTAPNSSPNAMRYTSALNNSVAANDWFFTPALTMAAGTRYQVAFRYRAEGIANSPSNYVEKLEVKVGTAANAAGQTTTLYTNANITNTAYALANGTSTPAVAVFTPGAGTRYVGFHVYSDAAQGNLYIDDLSITAGITTATTSETLLRAVTVFPNPSTTGAFDLEIHGANAKGNLGVLVTNNLGQQVYTGSARDNYTNKLDLSGLAAGLYHLQVRNGDETMTRQIAIVK